MVKKAGLSRQKRDCPAKSGTVGRSGYTPITVVQTAPFKPIDTDLNRSSEFL